MLVSADSIPVKIEACRLNRSAPSKVVSVFWSPLPCAKPPSIPSNSRFCAIYIAFSTIDNPSHRLTSPCLAWRTSIVPQHNTNIRRVPIGMKTHLTCYRIMRRPPPKRSVVIEPHGGQSDFRITAMFVGGFGASSTDTASRKPKQINIYPRWTPAYHRG